MVVVAGAGSGKTRVITERILHLISHEGIPPVHILAVTFTNKAADEMRRRLEETLGYRPAVTVGTFHATCARILRAEAEHLAGRVDRHFVIFDQADTEAALKKIVEKWALPAEQFHYRKLAWHVEAAKRTLVAAPDFPRRESYEETIAEVYAAYQELLRANNAFDFGDLIAETAFLFRRRADVLARWRDRYRHVLVDEYQDTNLAQYEILRLLAAERRSLCLVGDPDQSIYRWRGAEVANFERFRRDFPEADLYPLEQNYRSHQAILDAANALIRVNPRGPFAKSLWSDRAAETRPAVIRCYDERHEALRVILALEEARANAGLKYRDCAVLYRVNAQSRIFEEVFAQAGIPFQLVGGTRFYERKEVKDALAYIRLIYNPQDAVSFARAANVPPRGVGPQSLALLDERRGERAPLAAAGDEEVLALLPARAAQGLRKFHALITGLAAEADRKPVAELVAAAVEKSGYVTWLEAGRDVKGEARAENVRELISAAAEFEQANEGATLADFLEAAALVSDIDAYDADADRVSLMTLHTAKGLEFGAVFLVGLEEFLLPHVNALGEAAEIEEERRLCYVGFTRARDLLYLSFAETRKVSGVDEPRQPSRFLAEVGRGLVAELGPPDVDELVQYQPWGARAEFRTINYHGGRRGR